MQPFSYINGQLHCEEVPAETIARDVGTPAYVYSASGILQQYRNARSAFPDALICFSVKANSNGRYGDKGYIFNIHSPIDPTNGEQEVGRVGKIEPVIDMW